MILLKRMMSAFMGSRHWNSGLGFGVDDQTDFTSPRQALGLDDMPYMFRSSPANGACHYQGWFALCLEVRVFLLWPRHEFATISMEKAADGRGGRREINNANTEREGYTPELQ